MKFLFETQFSVCDTGISDEHWILLLKALLVLLCALFPTLLFNFLHGGFLRYFKARGKGHNDVSLIPADEETLHEEDCNETLHERNGFEEIETRISTLTFRFPTYEEFLRSDETVDSAIFDTSNRNDFIAENGSIPSPISDSDFNLHSGEDPENFPQHGLNCTSDIRNEELDIEDDDRNDSVEAMSGSLCDGNDSVEAMSGSLCDRKTKDSDELEWEELQIDLMKEKAKAKAPVLPSIPEESESTVDMEDLEPWRVEENFNHRDVMKELHKFHKIYQEKMQKYDSLNHQKMYAKELMQSKNDSPESVLSKSFWVCKPKKGDAKPAKSRELEGDLEVVYVVQLCLSWEFIVWQYKTALKLRGIAPHGSCRYNEVAGKFESFQVLIQRFMENEPFDEGSRVECYAKNRLSRRKILQVPLIREDEVKDNKKKEPIDDNDDAIKIDMLIKILQESIRILWQFIRGDKLANISTLKSQIGAEQECRSPAQSMILKQVLPDLQKKERKLKRTMKRKNCLLKNFTEPSEDVPDDELCFFSWVDLKLVSRVLNMQRITRDQLSWCHHKLNLISFLNGKFGVEPSSFLFPS